MSIEKAIKTRGLGIIVERVLVIGSSQTMDVLRLFWLTSALLPVTGDFSSPNLHTK